MCDRNGLTDYPLPATTPDAAWLVGGTACLVVTAVVLGVRGWISTAGLRSDRENEP
jgi:hypothetical protein